MGKSGAGGGATCEPAQAFGITRTGYSHSKKGACRQACRQKQETSEDCDREENLEEEILILTSGDAQDAVLATRVYAMRVYCQSVFERSGCRFA